MRIGNHYKTTFIKISYDPLPSLPPRGKENHLKPFPLGGNGKGGKLEKGYLFY